MEKPQLWSPDSPYLYSVKVSLKDVRGKVLKDETRVPLGVRWFSVDAQEGFKLNGEPLKLMGACRHQDQMPMGIALSQGYAIAERYGCKLCPLGTLPAG